MLILLLTIGAKRLVLECCYCKQHVLKKIKHAANEAPVHARLNVYTLCIETYDKSVKNRITPIPHRV